MVKSKIKYAIAVYNKNNPALRKKTLSSLAEELGVSTSSLSQIEASNQFQKHLAVVMESDDINVQSKAFKIICHSLKTLIKI